MKLLSLQLIHDEGILIVFKEVQSSNALSPIDVALSGISIDSKEVQPLNALLLMDVTL